MSVLSPPTSHTSTVSALPRLKPLLVREGARFDCFGDGLCCTDIHALGPVTRAEKKAVDLIAPGSLVRSKDLLAPVFRTQADGSCINRSERGCELHAVHGAEAKPTGCSRFPWNLIATPEGGRITTEHRCPCRTLGDRPLVTPEAAEPWLRGHGGRLSSNGKVGPKVALAPGRRVAFARYREIEQEMLAGLLAQRDPFAVIGKKPFGKLEGGRFSSVGSKMRVERDGTGFGEAMHWFGNAVRVSNGGPALEITERPWKAAFDRAEARSKKKNTAEAVLADWLADMLWSLDWVFATRSFEAGKRELVTCYAVALEIVNVLVKARVRPDRAAAEAVMVVELARQSEQWESVQQAL